MKDENGIYHVVCDEDILASNRDLNRIPASFIRGDRDLVPEDYGFLHPNFLISRIYNDEGEKTRFFKLRFNDYPIVWEKMEKVEGKRFKRIKVDLEDSDEYFRKSEEDYQKYLEDHERRKREGRYVIAAIDRWKYEWGKGNILHEQFYVGRIEGAYFFSPDIDERKKRVSVDRFRIFREISRDEQEQARKIIRKIKEAEENGDFLDCVDYRAEGLFHYGEDAIELKIRLRELLQEFMSEERCKVEDRLKGLKEELGEIGTEASEIE